MKLQNITIKNYRSIKEIDLEINEVAGKKCMILLGINESGKSNILKAINSKNYENSIDYSKDCNQEAENKQEIISIACSQIPGGGWADVFKNKGIPESLAKMIELEQTQRRAELNDRGRVNKFDIRIKDNKDFAKYVFLNNRIQLKTKDNIVLGDNEETTNLLNKEILERYLESFFDLFEHNAPKVIFWKAEDKYLINKQINLQIFKDNTNTSIPLRNCFNIAGIKQDSIKSAIETIYNNSAKKSKLQRKLSEKVTQYINTVWTEHKIKINFDIDNMQLSFLIEEQDDSNVMIDVSQRSDGFKQFISILLNLSIENETGALENKIILLDEPEIHLHPSGQKYLRDELLKIAENNIVIYATHSIYMVDKKNLDRHYHVQKDNGLTTVKKIEKDNPLGDEVLYGALGTSVLEHLEPNVLIVEGKTDRDIFNLYCRIFTEELDIPNISVISADGANNFPRYAKFFTTHIIKGFTLSDSDKDGKKAKNDVLAMDDGYTEDNVFEINDFIESTNANTLEDLFDKECLEKAVKDIFVIDLNKTHPFIPQIKTKKRDINDKIIKKNFMAEISLLNKEALKKQEYYKFFEELIKKINA